MWLAEVARMLRPVAFCREQAAIVNESLGMGGSNHPPLRWEAWRDEDPGRTTTWSYVSVVAVLSGAYLAGTVLGLVTTHWSICWALFAAALSAVGFVVALGSAFRVYGRWKSPASKVGMTGLAWLPRWPR
jgi:hypothetical protein